MGENGGFVTGIDISDIAILHAQKKAKDLNFQIELKVLDAEVMEFNGNTFDIICGTGILHHLNLKKHLLRYLEHLK